MNISACPFAFESGKKVGNDAEISRCHGLSQCLGVLFEGAVFGITQVKLCWLEQAAKLQAKAEKIEENLSLWILETSSPCSFFYALYQCKRFI